MERIEDGDSPEKNTNHSQTESNIIYSTSASICVRSCSIDLSEWYWIFFSFEIAFALPFKLYSTINYSAQ